MLNFKYFFDFGYNIDDPNYENVKLAYIINILGFIVLIFFSYININIKNNFIVGYAELFFSATLFISTFLHTRYKNTRFYLIYTSLSLLTMTAIFHLFSEKTIFSSMFLLFVPMITFLINGLKIGTILSTLFGLFILTNVYLNIGTYATTQDFIHILIILITFTLFIYLFERSRKHAFSKMIESMKKLEEISHLDELTKLYNRRYLNNVLLKSKEYSNKPFLFCISDIDNFKAYNDHYGHQKGDEVLKQVATVKNETIGKAENQYVIRLGGEEFGGFIFDSSKPKKYIDDFFNELEALSIEHTKNNPYDICTVSMGAVCCNNTDGLDFSKIYKMADDALYEAKASGKNRVIYKFI